VETPTKKIKALSHIIIQGEGFFEDIKLNPGDILEVLPRYAEKLINKGQATHTEEEINIILPTTYNELIEERKHKETIEKVIQPQNLEKEYVNIRNLVYEELIKKKNQSTSTEIIVNFILTKHHIYTIRSDEKPETWIYKDGIYTPNGNSYISEICREILREITTTTIINKVILKIQLDTYVDQKEFFNTNIIDEIIVENGILNLKTRELTPYNPEKIFFSKIPIKYNTEKKCTHIIQFLKDVLKAEEDLPIMQELMGYLLWKEYNIEKAFMLIGTGRNGKGKTLDLMKRFVGPENCASISLQNIENEPFSKSELHKKLANLCGDIDDRALKYTGGFKELTGRDIISASRKFKEKIYYENYAKMIFAANQLPRTRDLSDGFFMRWIPLDFPYTFVTQEEYTETSDILQKQWMKIRDPDIIKKITTPDEMSGLLNWALDGLDRLQKQKDFSDSRTSTEIKDMWLRKSDSFTAFAMDMLEEKYANEIDKSEIRHVYNAYCKKYKLKVASDKTIKNVLSEMYGVEESRTMRDYTRVMVWVGLDYKPEKEKQGIL